MEQSRLQRGLKVLDASAQGGVINAEPLGRNGETTSPGNGEEGLHGVPVERGGHMRFLATKPPIYQKLCAWNTMRSRAREPTKARVRRAARTIPDHARP